MNQQEKPRMTNKEALKDVWKYYMTAAAGIVLILVSQKLEGMLSTILVALGAVLFFGGFLIVLYFDRKARKKALAEIRAEAEANNLKEERRSKKRRK